MRGGKVLKWEKKLKDIFDQIDVELEEEYGDRYSLRPNRPQVGETANPEASGLFNIGAAFSAGYGSEHGRGYIVRVHMSASSKVPGEVREAIERKVAEKLKKLLPENFGDQDLRVERDGNVFKIVGDFGLD